MTTLRTLKRDADWVLDRPKLVGLGGVMTAITALWHLQFSLALAVAVAEISYGLWRAPTVCGAATETRTCRNNGKGMIRGCHIQEHNEQRVTTYLQRHDWHQVEDHMRRNKIVTSLLVGSVAVLVLGAVGWMVEGLVHLL